VNVLSLVRARERDGLPLSRIAQDAGVDYHRLWRACRGGNYLHPSELERLTHALERERAHYSAAV
jgi:hypothetical protein